MCETRRVHFHIGLVRSGPLLILLPCGGPCRTNLSSLWELALGERAERARGRWGVHVGHGHGTRLGAFFERLVNAHGASAKVLPSTTSTPSLTRQQLAELLSRSSIFSISCRAMGVVSSFEGEGQVRELSPMRTCLPRTSLRSWKKEGTDIPRQTPRGNALALAQKTGSLRMPAVLPLDVMAELLGPTAKMT